MSQDLRDRIAGSWQVGQSIEPVVGSACLPDEQQRFDSLSDGQSLMEENDAWSMLATCEEVGKVAGHRMVIVTYQYPPCGRNQRQHIRIVDSMQMSSLACLEINLRLAPQQATDDQLVEVDIALESHTLNHVVKTPASA